MTLRLPCRRLAERLLSDHVVMLHGTAARSCAGLRQQPPLMHSHVMADIAQLLVEILRQLERGTLLAIHQARKGARLQRVHRRLRELFPIEPGHAAAVYAGRPRAARKSSPQKRQRPRLSFGWSP